MMQQAALVPLSRTGLSVFAAVGIVLSGCSTTPALPVMTTQQANQDAGEQYRLNAGDKIRLTVFDEPNLTGEYELGRSGELALPLLNRIDASGLSASALSERIAAGLSQGGFVLDPRVAVEILSYRPVYVLGEVENPGEYPFAGDLSFLQAIAKAGGFTPRANKREVVLQRAGWDTGRVVQLDATPLLVVPGDTITIRQAFF